MIHLNSVLVIPVSLCYLFKNLSHMTDRTCLKIGKESGQE